MADYFSGVDNVFIHFDDADGLYEGGQELAGRVVVLVTTPTQIRAVKEQPITSTTGAFFEYLFVSEDMERIPKHFSITVLAEC